MGIDAHITGGSAQALPLPVGNVLLGLWITILLGHAKVDDVNRIGRLCIWPPDQKIVGLDIAIDEVLFMYRLDPRQLKDTQTQTTSLYEFRTFKRNNARKSK
jgi:hypothetical protein